ncbi:protein of unknown function [Taphrina deformans PYCC 5710]|uniref:Uncharacterized protein n=1 Tax=Taphrina deformans (strain PYCC 5710 / ATCC 11124 / CBS 356.35 / IMI 108563 / JCM 9778 / NBRC 8474) TaxID=1097556 RepID=R4XB81_TAPDE|nr:protein of unknown function [Taphrina deformans PYCC 5710]|eukprot:CCG83109.1 protein of unknown function [Taphrina deformans PYCC 5710]
MLFVDKALVGRSPKAIAVALRRAVAPQTIYLSSGKPAFPILIYACALVNLVFWGNLSQWVYSDYSVKDESVLRKFEKAPTSTRLAYSGGLATLGIGISTGFLLPQGYLYE